MMFPFSRRVAPSVRLLTAVSLLTLPLMAVRPVRAQGTTSVAQRNALLASREAAARTRVESAMRRAGVLGSDVPLSRAHILPPNATGTTADGMATRATSTKLSFSVANNVGNRSHVKDFVSKIYPFLVKIYGEPAPSQRGKTVSIESGSGEGYGTSLNGATGGYISYAVGLGRRTQAADDFALTQLMLNAFHGRQLFAYSLGDANNDPKILDAWEMGFSYAAALQAYFLYKKSPANFDPTTVGPYLLPSYDFFNKPELGSPLFSAANLQAPLSLTYYRYYMAQAVWLKAFVENADFFKNFNAAYYTSVASNAALAGNPDGLVALAAAVMPQIEGLRFADWYRRQYVLDTRASTGEKIYIGGYGSTLNLTTDGRHPYLGFAQHFRTYVAAADIVSGGVVVAKKGEVLEEPVAGNATIRAFDENGVEITSKMKCYVYRDEGKITTLTNNVIPFDSAGDPGEATFLVQFTNTGTPDTGRVTLQVAIGSTQTSAIVPNNVAGSSTAPTGYNGVYDPATAGSVVPVVNGKVLTSVALQRGAFSSPTTYTSGARTRVEFRLASSAGTSSVYRNAAWSWNATRKKPQALAVLLDGVGTRSTVKVQLGNTLRLVSLPLKPELSDEAAIFGIAPDKLSLAHYRTEVATGSGIGLQTDKYERYPRISQPPGPGVGYWIHPAAAFAVNIAGTEPSRAQRFEMPLRGGWNQFGVPYNLNFSVDAVRVRTLDGVERSYPQAVAARVLLPGVWGWKAAGGYTRVDVDDTARRTLVPFEGYFVYAVPDRGVILLFNASQPTATFTKSVTPDWSLTFAAAVGTSVDGDNALGTVALNTDGFARRVAAPKPALPEAALVFAFDDPNNKPVSNLVSDQSGGWAESYAPTLQAGQSAVWRFHVSGAPSGSKASISWSDPAVLPSGFVFTLIDETSGARWNLRYAPRTYPWTSNGSVRRFRVEATPMTTTKNVSAPSAVKSWDASDLSGSLQTILTLQATPEAVAGGATVRVEIVQNGEVVATLATREVARATMHWNWNGQNAAGAGLAAGHYTARFTVSWPSGGHETRETLFSLR